jgi:hypothetical protein
MRELRRPWYIIDPGSVRMSTWDACTALALIFTALATPFEVGFMPPPRSATETLFIVNRLIDGIFFVDMATRVPRITR